MSKSVHPNSGSIQNIKKQISKIEKIIYNQLKENDKYLKDLKT